MAEIGREVRVGKTVMIPEVEAANVVLCAAKNERAEIEEVLRIEGHKRFMAAGGCETCHGTGQVATWSTLDGPSYTEWGTCPNSACTAKVTGRDPSYGGSYQLGNGYSTPLADFATPEELAAINAADKAVYAAMNVLAEAQTKYRVTRGKTAEVVKGKKIPVGTKGEVFWLGPNKFGPGMRAGLKTPTGETVFVDAAHLMVLA